MEHCVQCPTRQVVDPPVQFFQDYFYPQIVQVIHPIEIVRRHHCVPVPHHVAAYSIKDEMCTVSGRSKRRR